MASDRNILGHPNGWAAIGCGAASRTPSCSARKPPRGGSGCRQGRQIWARASMRFKAGGGKRARRLAEQYLRKMKELAPKPDWIGAFSGLRPAAGSAGVAFHLSQVDSRQAGGRLAHPLLGQTRSLEPLPRAAFMGSARDGDWFAGGAKTVAFCAQDPTTFAAARRTQYLNDSGASSRIVISASAPA